MGLHESEPMVNVQLLDSHDHSVTIHQASGIAYTKYNGGRGPTLQMFFKVLVADSTKMEKSVLMKAVDRALEFKGLVDARCVGVTILL